MNEERAYMSLSPREIVEKFKMVLNRAYSPNDFSLKYAINTINRINNATKKVIDYQLHSLNNVKEWGKTGKTGLLVYFEGRVVYRLRSGIGVILPPFESGIFVHPVFFVPYIHGSSFQGVVRYSLYRLLVKSLKDRGFNAENYRNDINYLLEVVFGSSSEVYGHMGFASFYDAYPVRPGIHGRFVVGDVVTPHYHGSEIYENDAQPRPAKLISVDEGVVFGFAYIIHEALLREFLENLEEDKRKRICRVMKDSGLLQCTAGDTMDLSRGIERLLTIAVLRALKLEGIGGRTTRGYGRIEPETPIQVTPLNFKVTRI